MAVKKWQKIGIRKHIDYIRNVTLTYDMATPDMRHKIV